MVPELIQLPAHSQVQQSFEISFLESEDNHLTDAHYLSCEPQCSSYTAIPADLF